ncbi:hypothetical protein P5705_13540 [Pseudomonas entomophila]|nr:hypothetical protein [Pseudomonas entomophila]MDF9618670.1 hypothetical protein [Pseudomonas entomophila]
MATTPWQVEVTWNGAGFMPAMNYKNISLKSISWDISINDEKQRSA